MRSSHSVKIIFAGIVHVASTVVCAGQPRLDSLKEIIRHHKDTLAVLAGTELCYEYRFLHQDSAIYFGKEALKLAVAISYPRGKAQASSDLGVVFYDKGEFEKAKGNWEQSLAIRIQLHDSLKMASLYLKLGSLLFRQGNYQESLTDQLTSLEIYRRKNSDAGMSYALNNVAAVYEHQGQWDKALEYYQRSFGIKIKSGDNYQLGLTQINIGNIYFQKNDFEKGKYHLRQAISRLQPYGKSAQDYLAIAFNNLSDIYNKTHKIDSALIWTNKALDVRLAIHDYQGIVSSYNSLGSIMTEMKRYGLAKKYLTQALDSAGKRNLLLEKEKIYLSLYKLYELQGDASAALKNYVQYSQLKDSLLNEASQKNINELQVSYETEQKELQLSEQKALLTENALELQKSRIRVIGFSAAALVFLIAGMLIYQYQLAKRRKLQREAAFQLQLADAKLENELQQDRLRISRELHDNIGSRLLFISTATENLLENGRDDSNERASQLNSFARNTLQELRRTVWLINHDSVNLEELQVKLSEYFGLLQESSHLKINITLKGDAAMSLRSQKAAAIFRVAQEGVSNAIRHGEATRIDLVLEVFDDQKLGLTIRDNGKGFDSGKAYSGNGLKNMQAHADNARGTVRINSSGQGTVVELSMVVE
jgi:signal transduction histidine kinase